MPQPDQRTIPRDELVEIVDKASYGLTESSRAKWRAVAETTEAVAVGWFHCNGVRCPAGQANRRNQDFQSAFDVRMASRFGMHFDPDSADETQFEPFVVHVFDALDERQQ